jgi:hypothetical protein
MRLESEGCYLGHWEYALNIFQASTAWYDQCRKCFQRLLYAKYDSPNNAMRVIILLESSGSDCHIESIPTESLEFQNGLIEWDHEM